MAMDWNELTRITGTSPIIIEKVRMTDKNIAVEGQFELPPLARLPAEDQVFVMAFVRSEGTIKEMEKAFGVSYPTIKSRLSRIAAQLPFAEVTVTQEPQPVNEKETVSQPKPSPEKDEVIAALERGEISATEAIERLSK